MSEVRSAGFLIGGRQMRVAGDHDFYLDTIAGTDHSDSPLAKLVAGLAKPATILDVGANIGVTSIVMAGRDAGDRIFAFEPVPSNVDFLRQNLHDNRIENCSVVASAVGDTVGSVAIASRGAWSLVRPSEPGPGTETVPITTLDAFCAERLNGTRIDLIKIDVEGYEPNVLAGAGATIARWQPVIFLEFNAWALVLQDYNPLRFATALWRSFEVTGKAGETWTSPERFTSDTMVRHQSIDDLILRPRPGMTFDRQTLSVEAGLRQELAALRQSTSWRITAPLRAIRSLIS